MSSEPLTVCDDLVVGLDYTLRLEDGQVADTSVGGEPLQFVQGAGQIIPGLENMLYGMAVGDQKDVVIEAADGYGEVDAEAFRFVPKQAFPSDMALEEGQTLHMRDSDTQRVFPATVHRVQPDGVVLNFNHPLAGQRLHFAVKIVSLRPATEEELSHGHVHVD